MASVPSHWTKARLGEIAEDMFGGGTPSTKVPSFWQGSIPWLTSKSLGDSIYLTAGEKSISEEALRNSSTQIVPAGNLIFATRVGVGKVVVTKIDVAISQDSTGIIVDPSEVNPVFLAFYLRTDTVQRFVEQNKRGATIQGITRTSLQQVDVLVPPISEQRRIAHILSTVQTAIEQQERLIALTRELKAALMRKLFTEGLHGEKQKETEIGLVPESWEKILLEGAGDVIYGIQAAVANNLEPIGMKILTNKNISLDGQIVLDDINYFELKTKRHFEAVLRKGDILFNWRSGSKEHIGKTAYFNLDGEYTHSSFILRIRPNANVNGRFLFWYLYYLRAKGYFLQKHDISSINATFNKSAVDALSVFLPSKDEQEEVATVLDTVDVKIAYLKRQRGYQDELFRTLLNQLMTSQIRVNDIELEGLN